MKRDRTPPDSRVHAAGAPTSEPALQRWRLAAALALLAATVAEAGLESARFPRTLWGTHALAFLPRAWWLLLPLVALGWWPPVADRLAAWFQRPRPAARGERAGVLAAGALAAAMFWLVRERHLFWGDALPLSIDIPAGHRFHPDEPLTLWLHHALYALGQGRWRAESAIALASALSGGAAVALVLDGFLRRGATRGSARLAALVFALQGGMAIFHGHVENYAYVTLCLLAFTWSGIHYLEGRGRAWPAFAALLLGYAFHLTGALALPGALLLAWHGLRERARRSAMLATLAASLAVAMLASGVARGLYAGDGPFLRLWDGARRMLFQPHDMQAGVAFGARHALDLWSHVAQMGPLSLIVTALLLVLLPSRGWLATPSGRFVAACALGFYAPALIAGEGNLGAARNWDLFAGPSLALPLVALLRLTDVADARARGRLLVAALAASLFVCLPWTALNLDAARTEARVAALPLGRGRGAAMLGTRALNEGDLARAERLFERALAEDSLNLNAWSGLGLARARAGRLEEAARPLSRAAELRPEAAQYRRDLAVLDMRLERWASASSDWQLLLAREHSDRAAWLGLAESLTRLGRADSAAYALVAAAEQLPADSTVAQALADACARWVAGAGASRDAPAFARAWTLFSTRFPGDPRVRAWRPHAEALLRPHDP